MAIMAKKTETKKSRGSAKKTSNPQRESLLKELKDLLPKLDEEGLAFLVEQARVHLYNMQVEELNKAADAANSAAERTHSISRGKSAPGKGKASGELKILGTESGSSYYLHYRNDDVMFSRDEMIHLVKIVNAPGTSLEIRERLYNWMDRERKDVFSVLPVKDKFDDLLKILAAVIKKNFKLSGK